MDPALEVDSSQDRDMDSAGTRRGVRGVPFYMRLLAAFLDASMGVSRKRGPSYRPKNGAPIVRTATKDPQFINRATWDCKEHGIWSS